MRRACYAALGLFLAQAGCAVIESSPPATSHETYYIDARTGSDTNPGNSRSRPWKTLARASSREWSAGERLLLRAGTRYHGQLTIHGSGDQTHPILVDRYGNGPAPLIAADGLSRQAILITNSEYLTMQNLEITNQGPRRIPRLTGIEVAIRNFGTAHAITLSHLYIHDVFGSNVKDAGGGYGIFFNCQRGASPSNFDGLLITHNHLLRTDRNGICGSSAYIGRDNWHPSLHVVISNNFLEDIGGDGIVPIGTDGCLVEHNRIDGGRRRAEDYAAGIWPWSADNTIIQFNEVSNYKGTHDGQGYDADWNCRNTLIQYNYSHDNEGGFLLVCDNGASHMPWSAGNVHAVIRYNLSVNDGSAGPSSRIFHLAGPIRDTQIYNNTIYIGHPVDVPMLLSDSWSGLPISTTFTNNIFYTAGTSSYIADNQSNALHFLNNAYFGLQPNHPADPHAILANPQFKHPPANTAQPKPSNFVLRSTSPCRAAGTSIPNNGSRDLLGHPLPTKTLPTVGAIE